MTGEMSIDLQIDADIALASADIEPILERCHEALAHLLNEPRLQHELCVRMCGEAESAELNSSYRNKPGPTNVLSFPADIDVPEGTPILGDLAICWPVLQREAEQQNKAPLDHLSHLYVHGVLHLLGYDHQSDRQAQEMESIEIAALQKLSIANPYIPCD
jgi:probable rRNA maturation factor